MTQHTLSAAEEKLLDTLAQRRPFWGTVRAKYAEYGAMTDGQYECFTRDAARIEWERNAPRISGTPVRNKFRSGKKPRCASRDKFCPEPATTVVGQFGYCAEHTEDAREAYNDWLESRQAAREQDASAEAASGT